uniref:Large ribosomal subunit protein uL18c n=1 Tax=Balbiania investiens TaxID=111861 RepID=A0A4D6BN28_9FLOR|nr:ribosomal protein L18 [Balbiania investiens]QBX88608.1 ribosomal protein L18 [Balbiania investiens]
MNKKLRGTSERPRLYVFRSNKHIYAQIIDDIRSKTLITASSTSTEIKSQIQSSANCETSRIIGESIAKSCIDQGIYQVVFDRGNRLYHGRIKALAESAREAGISF